jgi:hypothetical protein
VHLPTVDTVQGIEAVSYVPHHVYGHYLVLLLIQIVVRSAAAIGWTEGNS